MLERRFVLSVAAALFAGVTAVHAETVEIVIKNLAFTPPQVSVKVGDTIEWRNQDAFDHTATAKGAWDVTIPAGKTGRTVVKEAGAYDYFCRFHPNMKGRITASQ